MANMVRMKQPKSSDGGLALASGKRDNTSTQDYDTLAHCLLHFVASILGEKLLTVRNRMLCSQVSTSEPVYKFSTAVQLYSKNCKT